MSMTVDQAFEVAINDGINIYIREVLWQREILTPAEVDELGRGDLLELKYKIARDLARKWGTIKLQVKFLGKMENDADE